MVLRVDRMKQASSYDLWIILHIAGHLFNGRYIYYSKVIVSY